VWPDKHGVTTSLFAHPVSTVKLTSNITARIVTVLFRIVFIVVDFKKGLVCIKLGNKTSKLQSFRIPSRAKKPGIDPAWLVFGFGFKHSR
jgi:hypothetical protein